MDAPTQVDPSIGDPAMAQRFLLTLFPRGAHVSTRPTETWTDGSQKRSRVDYDGQRTYIIHGTLPDVEIAMIRSKGQKTNFFYGVCPRFNGNQKFEKAWQIRQASALWADIDNATVADVLARIEKAGLPHPSAVVSSGNGVHVYWFLDAPYLIDDVGDPPPVLKEFVQIVGKAKKTCIEHFIDERGERVDLHNPQTGKPIASNVPELSGKAVRFQDIVAGIAASIGADHTFDLSRLLRVPGSWNRKNERNGAAPKPCELTEMTGERFPIERFAEFEQKSPERKRREVAEALPLPAVRKMTARKADGLAECIATCKIAEDRSAADFALCAFAIENGIAQDEVWSAVSDVGKFSERGRAYFDKTWAKAAAKTRLKRLENLEQKRERQAARAALTDDGSIDAEDESGGDDESAQREVVPGQRPVISHNPESMSVDSVLSRVTHTLVELSGNVYARAERPVVVHSDTPQAIDDTAKLAATLCSVAEFKLVEFRGENVITEYMPFPAKYGKVWLRDSRQFDRLPQMKLFTRFPVWLLTSTGWKTSKPGYDMDTGTYYAGPEVLPATETTHLNAMLAEFCFRSPADRTNYIGVLLTLALMPRFIGSKPGILLSANQQGTGKSKLAQIIAILQCGEEVGTVGYIDREEELEKRVGSVVRSGTQTIIVDNAKSAGNQRSGREIASAVLDRLVTDKINSFRLLGTSTDIRVENSLILAVTANQDAVSRDLITRLVPVNLFFEGDATKRSFHMEDPVGYAQQHRHEVIAELLGMVQRWIDAGCRKANIKTRFESSGWGSIIGGILEANGEPDFLANMDECAEELDATRTEFAALVEKLGTAMSLGVAWSATEILNAAHDAKVLRDELGDGSDRSQATRLGILLSRFVNAEFTVWNAERSASKRVVLKVREGRNGKTYSLREVSE